MIQRLIPVVVIALALLFAWREVQQGHLAYHPQQRTRNAFVTTPQPKVIEPPQPKLIEPHDFVRAVETASDGATLRLREGVYRLPAGLYVTRSITLQGAGLEKTRIISDDFDYVLKFTGQGRFTAQDVSFEHDGTRKSDVVSVEGGWIQFERCRFSGGIRNTGKQATTGDGLWVRGSTRGSIHQSEFVNNGLHGLEIQGTANLSIEVSTFERNTEDGLVFFDHTTGVAQGNTSRKNGLHGISVAEQANPKLVGNILERNTEVGLRYSGTASGAASGNIARKNGLSGIVVNDSASPTLEQNVLSGNASYGLYIAADARPTLDKNDLSENALGNLKDLRSGKAKP